MQTDRQDVYTRVTNSIVADLEQGMRPWIQPWDSSHAAGEVSRPLRFNGVPYRGINVVLLWVAAMRLRCCCPLWMTYKQAVELGGQVRRGEKGSLVVYSDTITRQQTDENGEEQMQEVPFLKSYTVFNCEQIDGLPARYYAQSEETTYPVERIERAEQFFANTEADIRNGGGLAYYSPSADYIQMPLFESFHSAEAYYATLAHEATHMTRHESRLAREFGRQRWGDEGYAMEELVAELGAAFLCADLGLTPETREDHAAYIGSWLKVLKGDKRAIFSAASHAQRATDFLHGLQAKTADIGDVAMLCS
jgi:antirestriction protein ArdC